MPGEVSDFAPMETVVGTDSGQPSVTAAEIARAAVSEAVRPQTAVPGSTFGPTDTDEPLPQPGTHMAPVVDPEAPAAPVTAEPVVDTPGAIPAVHDTAGPTEWPEASIYTEAEFAGFQEAGIDLPVSPRDVPVEFQNQYGEMVQSLVDTHYAATTRTVDAQQAIMQIQEFATGLKTAEGQKRLLLGLAMNSPDMFTDAVGVVTRMQEDPDYADTIRRGMEADIRMEAAVRMEEASRATQQATQNRQISSHSMRYPMSSLTTTTFPDFFNKRPPIVKDQCRTNSGAAFKVRCIEDKFKIIDISHHSFNNWLTGF